MYYRNIFNHIQYKKYVNNLPGPINNKNTVNGTITIIAMTRRHPRRRRGD